MVQKEHRLKATTFLKIESHYILTLVILYIKEACYHKVHEEAVHETKYVVMHQRVSNLVILSTAFLGHTFSTSDQSHTYTVGFEPQL